MSAASVRATQGLCCLLTVDGLLATRRRRATTDDRVDAADRLVKSVTRKHIRVGNARRVVHHERRKRCAFRPRPEAADAIHAQGREAAGLRTRHRKGCGMARSGSARAIRRGSRRHVVYGGWHNKRWIYAISAKPPFDPYSPPWPPPTPTRVRWRRAVRQAARRRCV